MKNKFRVLSCANDCQCLNIFQEGEYFEKCDLSGIGMHSLVIPEYVKTVVIMKNIIKHVLMLT